MDFYRTADCPAAYEAYDWMSNQRARSRSMEMPYILNCPISQYSFSFKIGATSRQTEGILYFYPSSEGAKRAAAWKSHPSLLLPLQNCWIFRFQNPTAASLITKKLFVQFFIRTRFFLVWVQSLYITLSVCMGCFQISFSDHEIAISIHSNGLLFSISLRVGPLYKIRKKGAWYSMFLMTSKINLASRFGTAV